ncbi:tetratricopeptide repeat protein [bacterium]|nr:tetratricopeptide repeat protein [bacterium]
MKLKSIIHSDLILILGIFIITFISYINSFHNEFLWDDRGIIYEDETLIQSLENIDDFFTIRYWQEVEDGRSALRPMRNIVLAIDFAISGYNPVSYHVTNLILHLINVLLGFYLIKKLSGKSEIAFIGALLYAIHPVHIEGVTWIKNVAGILSMMFSLIVILEFINLQREDIDKTTYNIFRVLNPIMFLVALFSKNDALVIPLILLCYLYLFKPNVKNKIFKALPYWLIAIILFVYKQNVFGYEQSETSHYFIGWGIQRLTLVLATIQYYVKILFLPIQFIIDVDFPKVFFFADPQVLTGLVIVIISTILVIVYYRKKPAISFWILWLFITLISGVNLIPIWSRLVADQRLYMPALGFCAAIAYLFYYLYKKNKIATGIVIAAIAIFFSWHTIERNKVMTGEYSLWTQNIELEPSRFRGVSNYMGTIYERAVPESYDVSKYIKFAEDNKSSDWIVRLAYALLENGNYQFANELLNVTYDFGKKADSLMDSFKERYPDFKSENRVLAEYRNIYNLDSLDNPRIDRMLEEIDEEDEQYYKEIYDMKHEYAKDSIFFELLNQVKSLYIRGDTAKNELSQNIIYNIKTLADSSNVKGPFKFIYANLLGESGHIDSALVLYDELIEERPNSYMLYINEAILLIRQGDLEHAESACQKAIEFSDENYQAYDYLGYIYLRKNNFLKAEEYLNESLYRNNTGKVALNFMGISRAKQGDYKQAKKYWEKALSIHPNFTDAKRNLELLEANKNKNN